MDSSVFFVVSLIGCDYVGSLGKTCFGAHFVFGVDSVPWAEGPMDY